VVNGGGVRRKKNVFSFLNNFLPFGRLEFLIKRIIKNTTIRAASFSIISASIVALSVKKKNLFLKFSRFGSALLICHTLYG
jgi:hypothetical protein